MTKTDEEAVVRAATAAVAALPQDLVERLGDERTFDLLAVATTEAIRTKFSTEPDAVQIQRYVGELKARFPDGAELIKPIVAEAVIRSVFGHDELLDGLDVEDVRALLFLLPYAIVTEENIHGARLDEFVGNVLATAREDQAQ